MNLVDARMAQRSLEDGVANAARDAATLDVSAGRAPREGVYENVTLVVDSFMSEVQDDSFTPDSGALAKVWRETYSKEFGAALLARLERAS